MPFEFKVKYSWFNFYIFIIVSKLKTIINRRVRKTILSDASSLLQLMNTVNIQQRMHVTRPENRFEICF